MHYQRWRTHGDPNVVKVLGNKRAQKHGHRPRNAPSSPTYQSWRAMKRRCLNPNDPSYHYYGGRGISIYEPWLVFENFLADMGERPEGRSLDRIDADGDYEPENCRWADALTQSRNRRR